MLRIIAFRIFVFFIIIIFYIILIYLNLLIKYRNIKCAVLNYLFFLLELNSNVRLI